MLELNTLNTGCLTHEMTNKLVCSQISGPVVSIIVGVHNNVNAHIHWYAK